MKQIRENIPIGKHIAHAVNGEVKITIKADSIKNIIATKLRTK